MYVSQVGFSGRSLGIESDSRRVGKGLRLEGWDGVDRKRREGILKEKKRWEGRGGKKKRKKKDKKNRIKGEKKEKKKKEKEKRRGGKGRGKGVNK